ncbi:MAG: GFA family protein [Alphaproteobacteria bacterium]|nr:GFA family protein [Alphaproteobacteria bacterium]
MTTTRTASSSTATSSTTSSSTATKGHCLCKATTWSFEGKIGWACYCHCDDCRRNCGAPVVAWLGVPLAMFTWTGQAPKSFESSTGVTRYFCGTCGSPLAFEAEHYPGDMHLYAASLEDPSQYDPGFHVFYEKKLPWLSLADGLEKHPASLEEAPQDFRDDQ